MLAEYDGDYDGSYDFPYDDGDYVALRPEPEFGYIWVKMPGFDEAHHFEPASEMQILENELDASHVYLQWRILRTRVCEVDDLRNPHIDGSVGGGSLKRRQEWQRAGL